MTDDTDPADDAVTDADDTVDDADAAAAADGDRDADAAADPEKTIAELKDTVLRARAEVENIRRRSQNEIVAARKYAIEGFAQELLVVRDSLEQAAAVELELDDDAAGESVRKMKQGLGLTLKQLDRALARFAVTEVAAAPGTRFDPQLHQAVSATKSADTAADHIVTVVQKGFTLKERLLRPAMVVVAAGDDGDGGDGDGDGDGDADANGNAIAAGAGDTADGAVPAAA